jgi:hypothetical protein
MLGAALLHADTYEEVEADQSATGQAFAVVLMASVAAGIGTLDNHGPRGILWIALWGVLLWWVWAWITYMIGTRLLPAPETEADHGQLLRTIGFSSAPGLLHVFGLIPSFGAPVFAAVLLWMLVAMVVAVRQSLDYRSTLRAVAVCAIPFPIYALGMAVSLLLLGPWPL